MALEPKMWIKRVVKLGNPKIIQVISDLVSQRMGKPIWFGFEVLTPHETVRLLQGPRFWSVPTLDEPQLVHCCIYIICIYDVIHVGNMLESILHNSTKVWWTVAFRQASCKHILHRQKTSQDVDCGFMACWNFTASFAIQSELDSFPITCSHSFCILLRLVLQCCQHYHLLLPGPTHADNSESAACGQVKLVWSEIDSVFSFRRTFDDLSSIQVPYRLVPLK